MAQERTYISFDWALKKLLRQKANFGILEGFLSDKNYQAKGLKEVEEKMRIEGLSPEEKTAYERHQLNRISERNIVNTARMEGENTGIQLTLQICLLYTSPSPRDRTRSRMPSSA